MEKLVCFGIPSIFSFASEVCKSCSDFGDCQRLSHAALKGAPAHIVRPFITAHEAYEQSQAIDSPTAATLNTTQQVPHKARVSKRKAQRFPLTEDQKALLAPLSKTAANFVEKLFVRHADQEILSAAREGRNGFNQDKHRPYHLAMNMLLESGFVRPVLRQAYMDELGWSNTSAKTQVSLTWQVFIALGLANEDGIALVPSDLVKASSNNVRYQ